MTNAIRLISVACLILSALVVGVCEQAVAIDLPGQAGFVKAEFIYEAAPFPECHASTIVKTPAGLVAAWFGGTHEKHPDVGIWLSRHINGQWTAPIEVANGVESLEKRFPTWNPVLFQPASGPLVLFYKAGPSPDTWWGMRMTSNDHGATWSKPARLPDGILGPVRNKPVQLADGTLLCGSSTEDDGWRVHLESTRDLGLTWTKTKPLNTKEEMGAIQPTILQLQGRLAILCRSRQGKVAIAESTDNGQSWSRLSLIDLPNPNSGIDGVTMRDGRSVLVYNHTPKGRSPLNVAMSKDGKNWESVFVLEEQSGEFSYPAVIQSSDGLLHVTYTAKRRHIRHVVLDPAKW